MQTLTRELQKVLDLIVSLLMDFKAASPSIVISDCDTASTDGKAIVRLPSTFLGSPIADQLEQAIGLLAHEVGHWLQPLDKIKEIEKRTGLNHDICNLLLDIQLEENVVRLMPLFKHNFGQVRASIGSALKNDYIQGMTDAQDFLTVATYALLYGRFCGDAGNYSFTAFVIQNRKRLLHKFPKLAYLVTDADDFRACASRDLPAAIEAVAKKYPELCDHKGDTGGPFLNPTDAVSSSNTETLARLIGSNITEYSGVSDCREETGKLSGSIQPSPEVLAISRSIQRRWEVNKSSGTIMGPGRMDRLAAVRGDPIPFQTKSPQGRSQPKVKVLLVADYSGSMNGRRWAETIRAAQAVTLAIRNTDGEALGAIFEGMLIHEVNFNSQIFFSSAIASRELTSATGSTTSFGWLPLVWQLFPQHRIVLLTDGNGLCPPVVPTSARKRTSAILLQIENHARAKAQATVQTFAERSVFLDDLNEIASAWSVVIPRLAQ